ncbi:L-lysine exporter family protein LysE/ArgO [Arthrobacter pascens]|uniref:LysE/ArgO family amino acid transporter n=1 Tax=Arthrobacter pascens TaxID=1677 RepID=UPI0028550C82|nr:LysE/ArgO family amino acid transporter [Arthrobacter pascens]MDR6556783.1 L-lysine exporter family protein LysE/ArgO [Arthrobacter pascens]
METTATLSALATGFGAGLSLIVAIGAQNAFVLRQGLRREHLAPIVAVCVASDALLIAAGVAGVGALIQAAPLALVIVRWAGAAFLLAYAFFAARRALKPSGLSAAATSSRSTLAATVGTAVALTWLNPHVYLDTVVLLGSLAADHGEQGRWPFAWGAIAGSTLWFSLLGFGARYLAPVFARPGAWRVLDGAIALLMLALAAFLVMP